MRLDGRKQDEIRPITITPGYLRYAEGSVLLDWGKNRIICAATVETRVPTYLVGTGQGWVTAEYAMLPRSSKVRVPRDSTRGKPNGRALEIQRLIGRALRAVVDLEALGERTILIDCDVVEADGGTRTACITGAFVALALAVNRLRQDEQVSKKASLIRDYIAAVSVGIVEGRPVLDLNYLEDSTADTDMNVVMTGNGQFVELQGTAEKGAFPQSALDEMLVLGRDGIARVIEMQKEALEGIEVLQS